VRIPDTALTPVSSRFWLARQVELTLLGLPAIGGARAGAVLLRGGIAWGIPAATVAWLAASWVVEYGRYRSWGYAERGDDLIVNRGLLFRRLSVVPYGRMQFVDVTAGPIERVFGLATVRMHTAAAASDARIPGLSNDEAARLRDQLAALGESRAAGL
jgi:membrane protein YdbS with pleckstrin-like domain